MSIVFKNAFEKNSGQRKINFDLLLKQKKSIFRIIHRFSRINYEVYSYTPEYIRLPDEKNFKRPVD